MLESATWYLQITRVPGHGCWSRLGYRSTALGDLVWEEIPHPMPVNPLTEKQVLDELYSAMMDHLQMRA
jgi:hypothetical protein